MQLSEIVWIFPVVLVIAYVALLIRRRRRADSEKTQRLIDSMLKNCKQNLGVEVDAASIQWLVKHQSFAALIWDSFETPDHEVYFSTRRPQQELRSSLEAIISYDEFKQRCPAATAVFDHAIRWFDGAGNYWQDQRQISKQRERNGG